jgi:hypothetical protein
VTKTVLPLIWSDNVTNFEIDNLADMATNLSIRPPTMKEVINMALKPGYNADMAEQRRTNSSIRYRNSSALPENVSRIEPTSLAIREALPDREIQTVKVDSPSRIEEIDPEIIPNTSESPRGSKTFESPRGSNTSESPRGSKTFNTNTRSIRKSNTASISERINNNHQQRQKLLQH